MKLLGLTLIAAGALALASAAEATVILHIKERPIQFPPDYDLQVDLEVTDVSGDGLLIIGFDLLAPDPITDWQGFDFFLFDFLGVQDVGTNALGGLLWGALGGPITNGYFAKIFTFSLAQPGLVELDGLIASPHSTVSPYSTVRVCDHTPLGGGICTPEPGTAALLGAGLIGLALGRRL